MGPYRKDKVPFSYNRQNVFDKYLHMEYNGKTKGVWDVILLFKIFIVTGGME